MSNCREAKEGIQVDYVTGQALDANVHLGVAGI